MRGMRRFCGVGSIVLLIVVGAMSFVITPSVAGEKVVAPETAPHLQCVRQLREILALKAAADDAIAGDDIAGLGKLHAAVRAKLWDAQQQMDRAFLIGAWRSADRKRDAAELMGRLEGVGILNFISLGFLNGYDHPTNKVPPSVADATAKMFAHLDGVTARLELLNDAVATKVRR